MRAEQAVLEASYTVTESLATFSSRAEHSGTSLQEKIDHYLEYFQTVTGTRYPQPCEIQTQRRDQINDMMNELNRALGGLSFVDFQASEHMEVFRGWDLSPDGVMDEYRKYTFNRQTMMALAEEKAARLE